MTQRNPEINYKEVRANDPLAELTERAKAFWKEKKQTITATEISNCCNAISAILQSFPQ